MTNLVIEIDAGKLRDAIVDMLSRSPNMLRGNPLPAAIIKALTDNQERLESWAREQVLTVLADAQFRDQMRREIKAAMLAEAQSIGRKAARAAANAQEGDS